MASGGVQYGVPRLVTMIAAGVCGIRERYHDPINNIPSMAATAAMLDEIAALCFGLNIVRWKVTTFLLGNFLIGVAGAAAAGGQQEGSDEGKNEASDHVRSPGVCAHA